MDWRVAGGHGLSGIRTGAPDARSHTGVRGMMMLTRVTASELGLEDRTDARQSLRGGARFFKDSAQTTALGYWRARSHLYGAGGL